MYKHGSAPTLLGKRMAWPLVALCALVVTLGVASAAHAETATLGRIGVNNPKNTCTNCHYLQVKSSPEAGYVVPPGEWTITSWSGMGGEKAGLVRFDIYRPTGVAGQYAVLSQSEWETVPAATVSTFPIAIAVQGGDVLGLATGPSGYPALIQTKDEGDLLGGLIGAPPSLGELVGNGTAREVNTSGGSELNVAVTLERPDPLPIEAPAPAAPVTTTPAAQVANGHFTLGKQWHKRGSAVVGQTITVSGPGTLSIGGKGIGSRQIAAPAAGPIAVAFTPQGGLLGSLIRHGKAKGTAQIAFTPTGGSPATRTETVHFRLAR